VLPAAALPERDPLVPAAGPGFFAFSEPPTSRGPVVAVGCLSDLTPAAGLAVRSYSLHSAREIWPSLFLSMAAKLGAVEVRGAVVEPEVAPELVLPAELPLLMDLSVPPASFGPVLAVGALSVLAAAPVVALPLVLVCATAPPTANSAAAVAAARTLIFSMLIPPGKGP
jgi:hypothetical protein